MGALDAESEHLVQDALERFRQSRSTVIVAHRLSTVRLADSIAVLKRDLGTALGDPDDKGSYVAECGSHDELMEKENGTYRGLVRLQNIAAQTRERESLLLFVCFVFASIHIPAALHVVALLGERL